MRTFKATLAYDGTGLIGWQRQPSGTSVQGLIEDVLATLDGRTVAVHGAGRTDAGVHALGQVASFTLERDISPRVLRQALNGHLPQSIRVLTVAGVPSTFHARFAARTKTYRYRIWHSDVMHPFERAYALHVIGPLDVEAMGAAAGALEGRHDFAAFQASGGAAKETERRVTSCRLTRHDRLLLLDITGTGFLRHMVRAIVGSLLEIGRGRRDEAWLRGLLESRDRAQAGPTVPPHGLFLVGVDYDGPSLAGES